MATLYDRDYVRWSEAQAQALRERRLDELDFENLAEEVEALAKRDQRELRSRLRILVQHLLKVRYTDSRQAGWTITINAQRDAITTLLDDSPSLRLKVPGMLERVYPAARKAAAFELDVPADVLPDASPFTVEEILGSDR
jgi:hypothetical protein